MNKKYMMFGLLGFCMLALVSAGLVNYLSNTSQVDMEISSPLSITNIDGDLSDFQGGESKTVNFSVTNLADVKVSGKLEITIDNEGISKNDFKSINVEMHNAPGEEATWTTGVFDILTDDTYVESRVESDNSFVITTKVQEFWQDRTWDVLADFAFKDNANGTYTVSVKAIPSA